MPEPEILEVTCLVQQLDDDDLEEFGGYRPSDGPPPGAGATRPWTNRRTGRNRTTSMQPDGGGRGSSEKGEWRRAGRKPRARPKA